MTAQLLSAPVWQLIDGDGDPISGGQAYFYASGTLVVQPVYTAQDLATPRTQPVLTDSTGRFPVMFLDNTIAYRVRVLDGNGTLIGDIDPLNVANTGESIGTTDLQDGSVTGPKLGLTAISDSLGFTPASTAGGTLTGPFRLNYATLPTVQNADDVGFRGTPSITYDAAHTLILDDAGRSMLHTSATAHTWSIPPHSSVALPIGTVIAWDNVGTGAVTFSRGAGVTLRKAGGGTSADVVASQFASGALKQVQTDVWVIAGNGIA